MANGILEYAGEYDLIKCDILINGNPQPIGPNVLSIKLFENMDMPILHGELVLSNTVSFADTLPLVGEERLELIMETPTMGVPIEFVGNKAFWVYQCLDRRHSRNLQILTLKFCSPEMAVNSNKTFSGSLEGTHSEIVQKILSSHIGGPKDISVDDTKEKTNLVFSNTHPFDAISQITSHAITKKSQPGFYFFEDLDGFKFKSIESMMEGSSQWEYQIQEEGAASFLTGGMPDIETEMRRIISHKMNHPDRSFDIAAGVFGSKLIIHDIFNKQIKTKDYNYAENFKKEKHIESPSSGAISFSSTRTNIPNLDVDKKENNTRVYYRPMSIKGGGGKGINGLYTGSHKLPVDINDIKIQQKNSQKHQLDEAFSIELLVHGNTATRVGQLIDVNVLKASEEVKFTKNELDNFYQGQFLVRAIRHEFLNPVRRHEMRMTCVKDSISPAAKA